MTVSVSDCVFCKIIAGKIPALKVYEDELAVAFWDANPVATIHVLIVPREHIPTLNDIPADNFILSHLGQVARQVAEQFGVDQAGYRVFVNVNRGGGQVVFHLHMHLVSRSNPGTR